jgi:hypothetical protein
VLSRKRKVLNNKGGGKQKEEAKIQMIGVFIGSTKILLVAGSSSLRSTVSDHEVC